MKWQARTMAIVGVLLAVGAGPSAAQDLAALPTSTEFPVTPPYRARIERERPVLEMSVRDVITRLGQANLDLAIERYNQLLARERVVATLGFYDPTVGFSTSAGSAINPLTAAPGDLGIPSETVRTSAFTPSLRQNIAGGGTISASVANSFSQTSSLSPTVNPSFASVLSASVTQPLLRGFMRTAADRQIVNGRADVAISDVLYRQKVTQVVQQALTQYWELVFASESYEARRQSRNLAVLQYESSRLRMQAGLVAPVALTAARAEIASRERDLLQAEVQIINAENALKLAMADDPSSVIWRTEIIPTDRPDPQDGTLLLEQAIARAREHRPEIEQLRLQLAQNDVDRKFFSLERKPTVTLTAGLLSTGKAGTVYQRLADGRVADPTNVSFGRYPQTWQQVAGFNFLAWNASLNVQLPIRNRSADAQFEQARLSRNRLDTQMTRTVQAVTVEVQNLFQVISTLRRSLESARLTSGLFQEQLDAQTARYELGLSSDFELLRYQRDLVDARVRELRALADLQIALVALDKATDGLMAAYGVSADGPGR